MPTKRAAAKPAKAKRAEKPKLTAKKPATKPVAAKTAAKPAAAKTAAAAKPAAPPAKPTVAKPAAGGCRQREQSPVAQADSQDAAVGAHRRDRDWRALGRRARDAARALPPTTAMPTIRSKPAACSPVRAM